ncbi:MAG: erythromycin esterase-like enzyme [Bryobacterales bacterium]|nr:erythromycin esterase-like enzyme [Bryobacterales bacterium]
MPRPLPVHLLQRTPGDYDPLLDLIGDASFVLLGEASHGTHEFYYTRAEITKRLIREKGFHAVAVEADWPDAYRVNRFVLGRGADSSADEALSGFSRFPIWMWRNREVEAFVAWLRTHNEKRSSGAPQVGFYGLDLYSLNTSRQEVIRYLEKVDPDAARRARYRYSCFDHYGEDEQAYGYAAGFGISPSCEQEVVQQLIELERRSYEYMHRDGYVAEDEFFSAELNARLVRNAEEYYRSMFRGRISSWNLRDRHMAETLGELAAHLDRRYGKSKIVVWEHNSHVGDARATEMGERGEWNVGQLVRERYGDSSRSIGFTTYTGTVMAASDWGGPHEVKRVQPGLPGSYEALFHDVKMPSFLLPMRGSAAGAELRSPRLERAIGVIYRPDTERISHYFHARLADQFDAVLHFDETHAVEPLGPRAEPHPLKCLRLTRPESKNAVESQRHNQIERAVEIPPVGLSDDLVVPSGATGLVLFAHGSGSGRHSSPNRYVARVLQRGGLATLLMDRLTPEEEPVDLRTAHLRFDIPLLAERLVNTTDWLARNPDTSALSVGYFGASTGGGATLVAAAERPECVAAVVSRGGRPDLAGPALPRVQAPTLLIAGGHDEPVIELNQRAQTQLRNHNRLGIVPRATHLFEEPGALERVAELALDWFRRYLAEPVSARDEGSHGTPGH